MLFNDKKITIQNQEIQFSTKKRGIIISQRHEANREIAKISRQTYIEERHRKRILIVTDSNEFSKKELEYLRPTTDLFIGSLHYDEPDRTFYHAYTDMFTDAERYDYNDHLIPIIYTSLPRFAKEVIKPILIGPTPIIIDKTVVEIRDIMSKYFELTSDGYLKYLDRVKYE